MKIGSGEVREQVRNSVNCAVSKCSGFETCQPLYWENVKMTAQNLCAY